MATSMNGWAVPDVPVLSIATSVSVCDPSAYWVVFSVQWNGAALRFETSWPSMMITTKAMGYGAVPLEPLVLEKRATPISPEEGPEDTVTDIVICSPGATLALDEDMAMAAVEVTE